MNLKKLLFAFAMAFSIWSFVSLTEAQSKPTEATLSGVVVDEAESAPIPAAHIWVHGSSGGTSFEARPDRAGKFSIQLPNGYYFVLVGAPGFAPKCKSIWVHDKESIVFSPRLSPDPETQQDLP
jgi:hypothetical protein